MATRNLTPAERFWSKVNKTESCWLWTACCKQFGYGCFSVSRSKWILAHRASWIFTNGPIPEGQLILHKCDNPPCVNPSHLFLGTHADNVADKMNKGRYYRGQAPKGIDNPASKLTESQVTIIRASAMPQEDLAYAFGVSQTTISRIQLRKNWSHIA